MRDQIEREHDAFCGFIKTLREYGNLLMDTDPDCNNLLNTALQLDPDDKSGDTIHNFCLALADVLDGVKASAAEPDDENVQMISMKDIATGCWRCLDNPNRQCCKGKL